jgi:Arc/MetJ-type ribon-helix-helix transcriptional regulator
MKRASITIPDDLERALDAYLAAQDPRESLTAVVQSALRDFLAKRGFLIAPTGGPLRLTPARRGSGESDGSEEHDKYLAKRR